MDQIKSIEVFHLYIYLGLTACLNSVIFVIINQSSVEHIPRAHIVQSMELLLCTWLYYNFVNFRKLVEMLLNVYVASGGPGDKKHSLCTRSNCIAVLHYDLQLVPQGCRFQLHRRMNYRFHEHVLLISMIFTSHILDIKFSYAHEQKIQWTCIMH